MPPVLNTGKNRGKPKFFVLSFNSIKTYLSQKQKGNPMEDIKQILQKAIDIEQEGYDFFIEMSKKVTHSLGRKMLEQLAEDELLHIARIKEIYAEIVDDTAPMNMEKVGDTRPFFTRLHNSIEGSIQDLGEMNVDDQEIIDAAVNLESETMFYYDDIANKTDNPKLKEFCQRLSREEKMHFEVLQKIPDYAQDPSLLFAAGSRF
jgi:rubrerythrin